MSSTRTEKQRICPSLPSLLPRCIIWKKVASQDQPDSSGRSSSARIASETTFTFPHMLVSETQSHRVPQLAKLHSYTDHFCNFQVSRRPGSKAGVLQCLGYSFVQPIFQIRRMESQASPTEATHGQRHSKAQKDPWTPEN